MARDGPRFDHPEFGHQIHARVSLPLLPSGRTIVRYLATNPRFPGVGWKTADRLWSAMGETLYDSIKSGDLAVIASIVGAERAVTIVTGFGLLADEVEVFRWLTADWAWKLVHATPLRNVDKKFKFLLCSHIPALGD